MYITPTYLQCSLQQFSKSTSDCTCKLSVHNYNLIQLDTLHFIQEVFFLNYVFLQLDAVL